MNAAGVMTVPKVRILLPSMRALKNTWRLDNKTIVAILQNPTDVTVPKREGIFFTFFYCRFVRWDAGARL